MPAECSKISECNFRSKAEREYAYFLEYERQMARIAKWRFEIQYPLIVDGKTVGIHIPDFTVWYPNGAVEIHEVKGGRISITPKFLMKRKLFQALYPHLTYRTIEKFSRPKKGRKKSLKTWDKQTKRWVTMQQKKTRTIQVEDL